MVLAGGNNAANENNKNTVGTAATARVIEIKQSGDGWKWTMESVTQGVVAGLAGTGDWPTITLIAGDVVTFSGQTGRSHWFALSTWAPPCLFAQAVAPEEPPATAALARTRHQAATLFSATRFTPLGTPTPPPPPYVPTHIFRDAHTPFSPAEGLSDHAPRFRAVRFFCPVCIALRGKGRAADIRQRASQGRLSVLVHVDGTRRRRDDVPVLLCVAACRCLGRVGCRHEVGATLAHFFGLA